VYISKAEPCMAGQAIYISIFKGGKELMLTSQNIVMSEHFYD
jgi:hypothetical protein